MSAPSPRQSSGSTGKPSRKRVFVNLASCGWLDDLLFDEPDLIPDIEMMRL